ncbi:hypothetical protein VNI00_000126 [Paramarasmius palmivorus]|uniref:Uncharacterized protein n=1 Tax=Paramarasmius palmivorus TaxID=297713 RepID=A0AAW0EC27_9AGAR
MLVLRKLGFLSCLFNLSATVLAAGAGSFEDAGDTLVSGMMLFVGNNDKVYILDKAESNKAQINGHSAWGAVWQLNYFERDINTRQAETMDVRTNVFCAAGMHLPNGSFVTFGGNSAIGPGDTPSSDGKGDFDARLGVWDGRKAIRILNPCTNADDFASSRCQWYDDPSVLSMQKQRWYAAAEPLGDGTITLIGGFKNGGYINRDVPNRDPFDGGAEPTYEFFPSGGREAQIMQFMGNTSGLNAYAHTYLMPSGKMLVQANFSTMLWDPETNIETNLPDMPDRVIRVYPASGAVAMLPLTPSNGWNPTVLFCGGNDLPDEAWGNYSFPMVNTWEHPASKDCQRLTPEPTDGSLPEYEKDDDMIEGRTMGQFIILPTGHLLVVNGGLNGTAGYSKATGETFLYGDMPFGMSLASGPVGTPAIYDPEAAPGQRWSNDGLQTSNIARLYHSSAILLPDASVLIAGSNPNIDVNETTIFPTEYKAEIFYPPYFSATTRPRSSGIPDTLSYGGGYFNITIPADSFSGLSNDAAEKTHVAVIRPGWTTHAMNMGQRYLQLNNTYTVDKSGSLTLHVSQMPPNSNIFQPGPAWVYVVMNGIPSNGTFVIVGTGKVERQPLSDPSPLPASIRVDTARGTGDGSPGGSSNSDKVTSSLSTGALVGIIAGAVVGLCLLGALVRIVIAKRRRSRAALDHAASAYPMTMGANRIAGGGYGSSQASLLVDQREAYNASSSSWGKGNIEVGYPEQYGRAQPYRGFSVDSDPYAAQSPMHHNAGVYGRPF